MANSFAIKSNKALSLLKKEENRINALSQSLWFIQDMGPPAFIFEPAGFSSGSLFF